MFSSTKIEEYMESKLSGIFQVRLVIKNRVLESPGRGGFIFTVFFHTSTKWYFQKHTCHHTFMHMMVEDTVVQITKPLKLSRGK